MGGLFSTYSIKCYSQRHGDVICGQDSIVVNFRSQAKYINIISNPCLVQLNELALRLMGLQTTITLMSEPIRFVLIQDHTPCA